MNEIAKAKEKFIDRLIQNAQKIFWIYYPKESLTSPHTIKLGMPPSTQIIGLGDNCNIYIIKTDKISGVEFEVHIYNHTVPVSIIDSTEVPIKKLRDLFYVYALSDIEKEGFNIPS